MKKEKKNWHLDGMKDGLIVYLIQIFGEDDEYKLSYVGAALGNRIAKPNFGNIKICLILTSRELI